MGDYYRVGSFVRVLPRKDTGRVASPWRNGTALCVAKRKNIGWPDDPRYKYFVVAIGAPSGYGCWYKQDQIQPLSPLELLASQS